MFIKRLRDVTLSCLGSLSGSKDPVCALKEKTGTMLLMSQSCLGEAFMRRTTLRVMVAQKRLHSEYRRGGDKH